MSPLTGLARDSDDGFPRVSGDEPEIKDRLNAVALFSPRERG